LIWVGFGVTELKFAFSVELPMRLKVHGEVPVQLAALLVPDQLVNVPDVAVSEQVMLVPLV
jgi:hypothetical protein